MALLVASVLGVAACGENIFDVKWVNSKVQTVLLYSLTVPELNVPSGYDFVNRQPVEIQGAGATGFWDLLIDVQDGQLVFVPPGALGIDSQVMVLAMPGTSFDEVLEAPEDSTLYTKDQPIPAEVGTGLRAAHRASLEVLASIQFHVLGRGPVELKGYPLTSWDLSVILM